ncbi:MAG: hypothetical protein ABIN25_11055 [Ginsengibacter sp.]
MPIEQKPANVDCPKWEPASSSSPRCKHYEAVTHECAHPLIGGVPCSEWTKLQARKLAAVQSLPKNEPTDLFGGAVVSGGGDGRGGSAVARQGAKARPKAEAGPSGGAISSGSLAGVQRPGVHRVIAGAIELGLLPPPDFTPAKEIDPKSIEALEGAVESIAMTSASMGGKEIVLVREVNRDDPRLQISFREAATIRLIVDCFPGAQVIDVRRREEVDP